MSVNIEKLPDKIKQLPYWRVNFKPDTYKTRIEGDPGVAFDLVEKNQIRLRGWPYPFISDERLEKIRGKKYIASGSDFLGHKEYWRLYYSGQFINLFTVREKANQRWDEKLRELARECILEYKRNVVEIPGFISILNLLDHFTEIFEFAKRLCSKGLYDGKLEINIEIRNIKGFCIIAEFPKFWHGYYPATANIVGDSWAIQSEQIVAKIAELALNGSVNFLKKFGWDNPPFDILKKDQEKFLLGKI